MKHLLIRPIVADWLNGSLITHEEYNDFVTENGLNSYERLMVIKHLDNEALCRHVESCIVNCQQPGKNPPAHYDDAVINLLAPLLIKRLREVKE